MCHCGCGQEAKLSLGGERRGTAHQWLSNHWQISKGRLSAEQIADIRARAEKGEKHKDIAAMYGLSQSTMSNIVNYQIYVSVKN
jgi:hypothetical protein